MSDNRSPGEIASDYITRNSTFSTGAVNGALCLKADPRRVAIRFSLLNFPGAPIAVIPQPTIDGLAINVDPGFPQEYLLRDYPSWVTGEWYIYAAGPADLLINECLYMR